MDIFPKGLTHGFGPKIAIFTTLLFRQYRPGKFLLRYSRTKKRLSKLLKLKVRTVEKLTFFHLFIWGKINHENVFYDILDIRNAFLGYKNINWKILKNWDFFQGAGARFSKVPVTFRARNQTFKSKYKE